MSPMYRVLTQAYEWGNCLMWALAVLSVPFWLYVAVYAVPEARMIAQQQAQDAIWRENRFFCARHGMPAGTREHAQCVEDLMKIRAQEEQRIASEMEGIL
jgi:hypothetical protein